MKCLYAIAYDRKGPTKFGASATPFKRLQALQTAHASRLVLLGFLQWEDPTCADVAERLVHRYLSEYRHQGEWFGVPAELACSILNGFPMVSKNIGEAWVGPTDATEMKQYFEANVIELTQFLETREENEIDIYALKNEHECHIWHEWYPELWGEKRTVVP